MFFCIHNWTKWSKPKLAWDHRHSVYGRQVSVQTRICFKCGKIDTHVVGDRDLTEDEK